jgi:hypothetical protein
MQYIISIILVVFVCACKDKKAKETTYAIDFQTSAIKDTTFRYLAKYGIEYNDFRRAQNLPILPDSFILQRWGGDFEIWISQLPDSTRPQYHLKSIFWIEDSLTSERNVFLGPKEEVLLVWYRTTESNPSYHHVYLLKKRRGEKNIEISRLEVDSILRLWKMQDFLK